VQRADTDTSFIAALKQVAPAASHRFVSVGWESWKKFFFLN
jgi:hypothetical protein